MNPSTTPSIPADWQAEFEPAARRPLKQRWHHAFIQTQQPVLDDTRFRSFDTLQDDRARYETSPPSWLGDGRVSILTEKCAAGSLRGIAGAALGTLMIRLKPKPLSLTAAANAPLATRGL